MTTGSSDKIAVGSIVRAKKGTKRCRAMVATVGGSDDVVAAPYFLCLLWEPVYPSKIADKFLITPKSIQKETEQDEATLSDGEVEDLLSFEADPRCDSDETSVATWKDRGDKLLRLGDASAAASFYEKALFDSSLVSIGGTVVISVGGFSRIAEVDCSDDDDGTIDVTLLHNGDEVTIKESAVLLGLLETDPDFLQQRILLNLARCMLQLSDLDGINRPKYLKSAVLATTLAFTLSLFRQEQLEEKSLGLPTNAQNALVLRCKAYSSLSKWPKATADARKLVKSGDGEQGQKLLASIERKKKIQSKKDKRLAKEICLLVQSATASEESETKEEPDNTLVSPKVSSSTRDTTGQGSTLSSSNTQDNQQPEAFTNSPLLSIPSFVLGIPSTYFIVVMAIALLSAFITKPNSST